MSQILFASFLLIHCLAEVAQSLVTNVTFVTTFNGLRDDYNLGHIGYVHLESDTKIPELEISSCQHYDVNRTTCNFADKSSKTEAAIMILRAWTALTLRDNMLVIFGYLMHQTTSDLLTRDTRSALRLLYDEIRRNGIRTMDLVARIKTMAKTSQVSQLLSLLKSLGNVVPPFCRSAVDELGKYFTKRKEILKNILASESGIDLFADIGLQMVPMLRIKNTKRHYDREIEASMGKEFAIFFAAIQEGRVILTQPVLAIFMLNMKFDDMSSMEMEHFRFICDILRLNKIPNWSPGFSGTCCANFKDPYEMVQTMMRTITERQKIDDVIKTRIIQLLPRLVRVAKTDKATLRMNEFFGSSKFNISLFFEVLEDEAKIPEVNGFRRMINDGTINLAYAFKGFVRYFYDTPRKLVLALVERTRYRVPMSNEAKFLVDAIMLNLREGCRGKSVKMEQTTNTYLLQ